MSETHFDLTLKAWMERAADQVRAMAPKTAHTRGQQALVLAADLLEEALLPYSAAVGEALAESEEAARAAEAVSQADVAMDGAYERLYATAQSNYYLAVADVTVNATLLKERLDRGMALPPSGFRALGLDRSRAVMEGALTYANDALGADHAVVVDAQAAYDGFVQARKAANAENSDAVLAMQKLFAARDEARRAYVAARQFVEGALSLNENESLRQLMLPLNSMYRSTGRPGGGTGSDADAPDAGEVVVNDAPPVQPTPVVEPSGE
ncbi:hypothetical protein DL240_17440 [Lujinxingia litoralis]|uniref:Uncharacterized protein n=1 Tax=Lujinxingia litoralis TaxID=2211119 RepID=A0A328C376_9DELT|nr:hypothetical protein [Lujinxingia litoralis]RAL20365.1 hypothetical protein DL240_17440 [Lujinxingia litoralis]